MGFYRSALRPLLFSLNPESAHHLTIEICRCCGMIPPLRRLAQWRHAFCDPRLECDVAGIRFQNPVGLAAGFDKNARAVEMLGTLGFGFVEIGSVSSRPSAGNPKPRLFRFPEAGATVVNYGLPNDGADRIRNRLAKRTIGIPLGINIVKTNDGPSAAPCDEDEVYADYQSSVRSLHSFADYLTLNLSCPNTDDGGDFFSAAGRVRELLDRISDVSIRCPVFLKVAPVDTQETIERLLEQVDPFSFVQGFIFNLPSDRSKAILNESARRRIDTTSGAISGIPIKSVINRCIRRLYSTMDPDRFAIIGAGGIMTAEDAYEKIRFGASLVQVYTGLIYEGPGLVRRVNQGLCQLLRRDGLDSLSDAVGVDCKT